MGDTPVPVDYSSSFFQNAVESEIRQRLINSKANACPIAVRLAWHASGTFDKSDGSGGSNGAGMRFEPESTDGANAGLNIPRDMLLPVKQRFPSLSFADIWTFAGVMAIKNAGGPDIPFMFGRTDFDDGSKCPPNGRLPDATLGAEHLREVFYRMGFDDKEIVALSGAHTLGRCHASRSGFDGPWTADPLKFDNSYFTNLLNLKWSVREWDGPKQYTDPSGEFMMLPTDLALIEDPGFKPHVEEFAKDGEAFSTAFAAAFGKLIAFSHPQGTSASEEGSPEKRMKTGRNINHSFLEQCMHGSLERAKEAVSKGADPSFREANSGRTGLHKAAFWGHEFLINYLINDCKIDPNIQDIEGDTALHDAARFGHEKVVALLIEANANASLKNKEGKTAKDVAIQYEKKDVAALL